MNFGKGRKKQKNTGSGSKFWEFVRTVAFAVLIAIGFRSFLYEPFSIPSGSMEPTLQVNDYLFVSKFAYGYSRYSFPFGILPIGGRIFDGSAPRRGDPVVFRKPGAEHIDFIKRLVGLPGDVVQVREGILHINGAPVERRAVARDLRGITYEETLPGGKKHLIREFSDTDTYDNTPAYTVPPGHYFFMGDNRDNSRDSRAVSAGRPEIGFVPAANLIGRAEILFFSHNGTARIWEFWLWPQAIRFGRIGQSID